MADAIRFGLGYLNLYRTLYMVLLSVLLYLLIQSLLSGMLYLNEYRLEITVDKWNQASETIPLSEWVATENVALELLREHENNTSVVNTLGRLYYYRSSHLSASNRERLFYGNKALAYYRTVTRLRPAWAYGWMNLDIAKMYLNQVDQEFRHALFRVLHLDPWSRTTLPTTIKLSLLAWPHLSKEEQKEMVNYFSIAQKQRSDDVLAALSDSNLKALYCILVRHHGSVAPFCH